MRNAIPLFQKLAEKQSLESAYVLIANHSSKNSRILELAIACNGADIVTHNLKDFEMASVFGIRAITPAQVLEELS